MGGSSQSAAAPNTVLNTAVAEELCGFADILENCEDFTGTLHELIRTTIRDHKRILFNGNGYDKSWVEEAERRGLSNLPTTPDALAHLLDSRNIELFTKHKVFSEAEMRARYEINLENYVKTVNIEALTMIDMARRDIYPAVSDFSANIADNIASRRKVCPDAHLAEEKLLFRITALSDELYDSIEGLEKAVDGARECENYTQSANYYKNEVLSAMNRLRAAADSLEELTSAQYWPYPSYGDLLFSLK